MFDDDGHSDGNVFKNWERVQKLNSLRFEIRGFASATKGTESLKHNLPVASVTNTELEAGTKVGPRDEDDTDVLAILGPSSATENERHGNSGPDVFAFVATTTGTLASPVRPSCLA